MISHLKRVRCCWRSSDFRSTHRCRGYRSAPVDVLLSARRTGATSQTDQKCSRRPSNTRLPPFELGGVAQLCCALIPTIEKRQSGGVQIVCTRLI